MVVVLVVFLLFLVTATVQTLVKGIGRDAKDVSQEMSVTILLMLLMTGN